MCNNCIFLVFCFYILYISLQLSLSGGGSDTEETYTDALIDKVRVLFRPGTVMQEAIGNLAFEKVPVKYKKEEETDEGLGA